MGFLSFILTLLLLVIIPLAVVMSFVKPEKMDIVTANNPNGKFKRKESLAGLGILWVLGLAVYGAITPKPEENKTVANVPTTNSPPASAPAVVTPTETKTTDKPVQKKQDFGITPQEFSKRFTAKAKEIGLGDNKFPAFKIEKGAVNDVFSVMLNDSVAMTGGVDKTTGNLNSITYMMGKTQEGDKQMLFLMAVASVTAQVLSPEKSADETGGQLVKMSSKVLEDYSKTHESSHQSLAVGNVQYTAGWLDKMGFMLGFEPVPQ